jgi:hypothetical protein
MMPSTVLHELAHYIVAVVLLVPRGRVRLFAPEQHADGSITLGYVETYYQDPLRHALIALAPVLVLPPAVGFAIWQATQIGTLTAIVLALVFCLPACMAAFPSPGDKPGLLGWLSLILFGGLIVLALWPQPLEWLMPLALIYGPAAILSGLFLAALRP